MPQDEKISELDQLVVPDPNDLLAIVDRDVNETKFITVTDLATGGIIAPADAQYVTLVADPNLTSERILTGTANQIIVTDGGAGLPVTLSLPQDYDIDADVQLGSLILDSTGTEALLVRKDADGGDVFIVDTTNSRIEFWADAQTDRWLSQDSNTFFGIAIAGSGNLAHTAGNEGYHNTFVGYNVGNAITTGYQNVAIGSLALDAITTGYSNVAIGYNSISAMATGYGNIAIGQDALRVATYRYNTAIGHEALYNTSSGQYNVGLGYRTLYANTSGSYNFAIGGNSLRFNTTGSNNTAIGTAALYTNVSGTENIAIGYYAGNSSSTTSYNTLIGSNSGRDSTTSYLTAVGHNSLRKNTSGSSNIGIGASSLYNNLTGTANVAIGASAGYGVAANSHSYNTFIGASSGHGVTTGGNNVVVGYFAGYTGTTFANNILIGYQAGDVLTTGGSNIIIGYDIDPTGAAVSNELNIGGLVYGNIGSAQVGINVIPTSIAATLHADQSAADGAEPVLLLDQADVSEEFIRFIGTSADGVLTQSLVQFGDEASSTGWAWVKVYIQDDGDQFADQAAYLLAYTLSA